MSAPEMRSPAACRKTETGQIDRKPDEYTSEAARSQAACALASEAVADAARLIAVNGLLAESAARRGDEAETFARLHQIAAALDDAREAVALARRIAQ